MKVGLLILLGVVTACGDSTRIQAFKTPPAHSKSYEPACAPAEDCEEKVSPPSNISGTSY
jgi:hypothetical protein